MLYPDKIIKRSLNLKYKKSVSLSYEHDFFIKIPKIGNINVFFNKVIAEETVVTDLCFDCDFNHDILGVLDFYFEIINNKPFEVINRIGVKDLDFFIRENNDTPTFKYYSSELYRILTIGETIYKTLSPRNEHSSEFSVNSMFDISYSEQIDYFEEFLAEFIYSIDQFINVELELINLSDKKLIINCHSNMSEAELLQLKNIIKNDLGLNKSNISLKLSINSLE